MMPLRVICFAMAFAATAFSEQFTLRHNATGREFGPFDSSVGSIVTLGNSTLTVVRAAAPRLVTTAGAPTTTSGRIPYETVRQWKIPAGGNGKLIVISPSLSTDRDLERLLRQLVDEARGERFAFVQVFTSREAALMRDNLENLSYAQNELYDKSYVGSLLKNEGQNVLEMSIMPQGMNGETRTLKQ